jgi:dipeptidyl aminopeptidase/acylaminoacyl peptidase
MRRRLVTAVATLALAAGLVAAVEMGRSNGHAVPARPRGAAPIDAPIASKVEDLSYRTSGGRTLGITLRRVARPRGLVVLVHGGGFRAGSRRAMDGWARLLTGDGYATATIDYGLAGPREHSRQRALARAATDTLAALGRLQSDSALRRLPVVLWGYSAGALTVLRVAADHPRRVRASVSLAGYGEPGRIRAGNPPMLLFNGTADRSEPVSRADATCRAARAVGVRCRQVVYPGATHALPETRGPDVHRTARAWLASILGH